MAEHVPFIDVSEHNAPIDFRKMAAQGVPLVIVRIGHGQTLDARVAEYVPAAKAAGLEVAGYVFCNPKRTPDGTKAARWMIDQGHELGIRLFMADVENFIPETPNVGLDGGFRGPTLQAWVKAFATEMTTEHTPIIYGNAGVWNGLGITGEGLPPSWWVVPRYRYYSLTAPQPPADARQWGAWVEAVGAWPTPPAGVSQWDAYQFSAGYNRMGATYGAGSRDLDLNIVRPQVYAAWLDIINGGAVVPPHPDVIIPPQENGDMPQYFTHAETDHEGHPKGWTWWRLLENGTKRHVDGVELDVIARHPRADGPFLTMAQIDAIPDHVPAPATVGPLTLQVTGDIAGTLSGTLSSS